MLHGESGPQRAKSVAGLGQARVLLLLSLVLTAATSLAQQPPWYRQLETAGIRFISAQTLKAMTDRGEAFVLVDARDEVWYQQGHIPGAVSIPAEEAPLQAVDIHRPKRLLYPERLPADRERLVVFYCGGPT
jgi:rhodanese-related sulfurtransferase